MQGTARRLLEDLTHTLIAPLRCRFINACVAFTAAYANPGSDLHHLPGGDRVEYDEQGVPLKHEHQRLPADAAGNATDQNVHDIGSMSALMRYFVRPRDARFDNLTFVQYYEQFKVTPLPPGVDVNGARTGTRAWRDCGCLLDEGNPSMVAPRRKQCVCRIHRRVPGDGGVYYLRALLGAKPGRAYSDLMTVTAPDGSVQRLDTFQAAAAALGIVPDGGANLAAMREAVRFNASPADLRRLFVTLICDGGNA